MEVDVRYTDVIEKLKEQGLTRSLDPVSNRDGCRVNYAGEEMLNLGSNDYLGFSSDSNLHEKFYSRLSAPGLVNNFGLGSASSRLLTGDSDLQHELEASLADEYGSDGALLFNSGYHANIGILPALCTKNDLILSDKLNHASMHDGLRLSYAAVKRYRHNDMTQLESLLKKHRNDYENCFIASESVFSMDGDVAELEQLVELKKRYDCKLYLDEAHSVGLYGRKGLGKAEEHDILADTDYLVGTFGKAYSSVGAFLICSEVEREFLINKSRSLIFTTALPPVVINWNLMVFRKALLMHDERKHLQTISEQLRTSLKKQNLLTDGSTNIVPVIIGDNQHTTLAAEKMREKGALVLPVRPPTVPEGTSRFRLSLTANMQWDDLKDLAADIKRAIDETTPLAE